jgi:hypothetical protein
MSGAKVSTAATWPVAAAVAFNLAPVAGVAFWGWSAFALIFLYWLENVVIGGRTVASMIAGRALTGGTGSWLAVLPLCAFFAVHYGLFCFVHGVFVVSLFGGGHGAFDLVGTTRALFSQHANLAVGFASIVLWQVVQFGVFIARGEARMAAPLSLMAAPYPRIIVLHLTILGGGFLLLALSQPVAGLVLLAVVKTGFDAAEALGVRLRQPGLEGKP